MNRLSQPQNYINLILTLFCLGLVIVSVYLAEHLGLVACSLCLLQRALFASLALLFFLILIHRPKLKGLNCYYNFASFLALLGIGLALRQIWLQHHISAEPQNCLPGLSYILETMPLTEALTLMLKGTADCAKETWTLLGLSLATWSLMSFVAVFIAILIQRFRR